MASALLTLGMTGFSIWSNNKATKQANEAATMEYEARKTYLDRKAGAERDALKKNTERQFENRDRRLAELRVNMAARNFNENGTSMLVFRDVKSAMDEQINDASDDALDRISTYHEQVKMDKFGLDMGTAKREQDNKLNNWSAIIGGVTKAAGQGYDSYRNTRTDQNPFSIFG